MHAAVFGLIVADLLASPVDLRHPPAPGGLASIDSLTLTTGGNVPNTGIAMAKLGLSVAAAGLVGRDVLGAACVEQLQRHRLDTSAVFERPEAQTSASVVAIEPGGERVFFHAPGVTRLLDAAAFRACFKVFARCRVVEIGYFGLLPALVPELGGLLAELKRAAPDVQVALDTVNPPAQAHLLWPILPHVDTFCPSRVEATALTGESNPARAASAFAAHMKRGSVIGIKLDAEGCWVQTAGNSDGTFVPAYPIQCIDTTGAGDTWFGGLLTGMLRGMPLQQAAKLANRAAADCCTAIGASTGVRSFDETFGRI